MRKWLVAAAGVALAAVLAWTAVAVFRPATSCGCALPPHLDDVDTTAYRWLSAVQSGDSATAWALLTSDAQHRHGDVDRFRAELPALAARYGDSTGRWQVVDIRTQGAGTPSEVFLLRVTTKDGVAVATGGLTVHSDATPEDAGRIDPDLGEPLQIGAADAGAQLKLPATVRVTNAEGRWLDFLGVPVAAPPEHSSLLLRPVQDLGGGAYRVENRNPGLTGAGLVVAILTRPDGRRAFGAVPVTFGTTP
jgi:hypothetical protein